MYEENRQPLPPGDATVVFADQLREIQRRPAPGAGEVNAQHVVHMAHRANQPPMAAIARRLLLPGSGVRGFQHLWSLAQLASAGNACLICLTHRCNLDVPTLYAMLEDQGAADVFHQIIWMAGRKLSEDRGLTPLLAECFNRIVLTPRTWFAGPHAEEHVQEARLINRAAMRALVTLRHDGWIFALFPSGTRMRPDDESTAQAIPETDSYIKRFDYLLLGHIDGCTLPVEKDRDMARETPQLDQVVYSFGPVLQCRQWRSRAAQRFPHVDQREATAKAVMEDIAALGEQN